MTKDIVISKLQAKGITERQAVVDSAVQQLNNFLAGVVAGHGLDRVQALNLNDETLVLTVEVPDIMPKEQAG